MTTNALDSHTKNIPMGGWVEHSVCINKTDEKIKKT